MNEEQQELLSEAYENYTQTNIIKNDDGTETHTSPTGHYNGMTKEGFINKCETDPEFSERWGLKIEERDLSFEERHMIWHDDNKKANVSPFMEKQLSSMLDKENIPTKLITISYNNTTIESYE